MKNKTFLLALLFANSMFAGAQLPKQVETPQLPQQVKAKLPGILYSEKMPKMETLLQEFRNGSGWGQDRRAKQALWIVYSDRENNTTYTSPDKSKICRILHFGQKVCIAEIKGDMALVYSDDRARYPDIPSDIKSLGWIPMEKLLLWNKCPTDQRGVLKKGIIAINLNKMSKDEKFQSKKYNSPDNLQKSEDLNTDMNFYYVMKETEGGEFALLSTSPTINSAQVFYGWVNKNAYTEWNQRSCLEPNWLPKFVETHRNQRVHIYEDVSRSSQATWWEFGKSNGDKNPVYKYRMSPLQLRFPILSQPDKDGMLLCTSFADRTRRSINAANEFVGSISGKVNSLGKQIMRMNIILAIEATTEMGKYLPAVKAALNTCKDFVNQGLTVHVGLVLYGGLDDGATGITVVPLSNYDDSRLQEMLSTGKANSRLIGMRNVNLSQALEKATNSVEMGFQAAQSNLLLVVGHHGTEETVWQEQKILSRLVANNVQLASIQVMRSSSGSSKRYFDMMGELIKQNIEKQYKDLGAEAKFQNALDKNGNFANDGYLFYSSLASEKGGNPLFASSRYNKTMDVEMTPEELTRYVSNSIGGFSKSVNAQKNIYEEALGDENFYPDFLIKKLGQKGYQDWKQVKAITAYGGYAHTNGLDDNDNWRAVLYLSSEELKSLIAKLKPISDAANEQNPDRTKYLNAIRELMRTQLGGSYPDKEIDEMDPATLEEKIYGIVNVKSENMRFTKHSLSDLSNRKTVSDDEYFDILDRFEKKYKKLRSISGGYEYRMEVGSTLFYWIPLDELP